MISPANDPRAMRALTLCAVLTALSASPAPALVFCRGHKSTIAVRDKCRKKEQQIDATTIGGLKGDPGAPGTAGPGLHVVDAKGNEVGLVTADDGEYMRVVRQINGDFFNLEVYGGGFGFQYGSDGLPSTGSLFYTDTACTSMPMVSTDQGPFIELEHPVTISGDGRTGYYGLEAEQQTLPNVYSIRDETGMDDTTARTNCTMRGQIVKDSHNCVYRGVAQKCVWCCELDNAGGPVSPAHTIDLTAFGLTPPFTLKRQ